MSLLSKLKKNSQIKESNILAESTLFSEKTVIPTSVPIINVALSGKLDGGFSSGLHMWAGPSKHFKTAFTLLMTKAYLDYYKDGVILFYDSEFGSPQGYFKAFGIDTERVLHTPIMDVEELKFDIMAQLQNIQRGEHVMIIIDSIGNLASRKEVDDALEQKSVADMSRAKQFKSLFRMITPHLTMKDLPMVVVNHTYKEIGMFPKDVVGGGTGSYYSADNIYIVGRQQEKEGNEVVGYSFIVNVEKSRTVREKSKIPVTVTYEGGISKWSGLMEIALDSGHVTKPAVGWYARTNPETGEVESEKFRLKDTDTKEFWLPILKQESFRDYIEKKYCMVTGSLISDEEISEAFEEA